MSTQAPSQTELPPKYLTQAGPGCRPVWIARSPGEAQYRPIDFYAIKSLPTPPVGLGVIWPFNSYVVDSEHMTVTINGGTNIGARGFLNGADHAVIVHWKRRRKELGLTGGESRESESYLLGLQAGDHCVLLHISETGRMWSFKNAR